MYIYAGMNWTHLNTSPHYIMSKNFCLPWIRPAFSLEFARRRAQWIRQIDFVVPLLRTSERWQSILYLKICGKNIIFFIFSKKIMFIIKLNYSIFPYYDAYLYICEYGFNIYIIHKCMHPNRNIQFWLCKILTRKMQIFKYSTERIDCDLIKFYYCNIDFFLWRCGFFFHISREHFSIGARCVYIRIFTHMDASCCHHNAHNTYNIIHWWAEHTIQYLLNAQAKTKTFTRAPFAKYMGGLYHMIE